MKMIGTQDKGRQQLQGFGRFLSGMVMPNIGAFIAWGFITALFIPTGWLPNEGLASLVGPMIIYLLPLLIGYTGGQMVGGTRAGVVGAVATMGIIVGTEIPMFIGAMVMGPFGGFVIKRFDKVIEGKIKAGFEMLVNNFSAGIIAMLLALVGLLGVGPFVEGFSTALGEGVNIIVKANLLPLASLFIEPAKILFLNNAINHGVLSPLGIAEMAEAGKSIFFLLETNPGPGLGILFAYMVFGKGAARTSSPGAIIIHFLGGIHEIYFPYVLMKPILVVAIILGGASGVLTFSILGAGLVATPSPGSIFALMAMTPRGSFIPVLAGVLISSVVSFLVASVFIKSSKQAEEALDVATRKTLLMKGKDSSVLKVMKTNSLIVVACDAGMGSSAMGATKLREKLAAVNSSIAVINTAIEAIPKEADIVITQEVLTRRAMKIAPDAEHISIRNFLDDDYQLDLVMRFSQETESNEQLQPRGHVIEDDAAILKSKNIMMNLEREDKYEAIRRAGRCLVDNGYVDEGYIEAMVEREDMITTYIGNHLAIPHGVSKAKATIKKSGIVVLQYPEGVMFDDEIAYLVIGIAGVDNEHLTILSNIASTFEHVETVLELAQTTDKQQIYERFMKGGTYES